MGRVAVIATLVMMAGAPLAAFTADNGVTVAPSVSGFAVSGDADLGARGIWCGAADYARSIEGARNTARLYIAESRTPGLGQRGPVQFTLDPQGLTPRSVLVLGSSLSQPGANLTVGHAFGFCADHKLRRGGSP